MEKTTSINKANIRCSYKDLFKYWLEFNKPIHKLSDSDIKVLAEFLYLRSTLLEKVHDEELLNEFLFSRERRKNIMETLQVDDVRFNNMLSTLRKKGVIIDNKINKAYIPNIDVNTKLYQIQLNFKAEEDGK